MTHPTRAKTDSQLFLVEIRQAPLPNIKQSLDVDAFAPFASVHSFVTAFDSPPRSYAVASLVSFLRPVEPAGLRRSQCLLFVRAFHAATPSFQICDPKSNERTKPSTRTRLASQIATTLGGRFSSNFDIVRKQQVKTCRQPTALRTSTRAQATSAVQAIPEEPLDVAMAVPKIPVDRQKFWFQFVTTPTADTPGTTLLLHFPTKRYLFGHVTEGTQRACMQRGTGLRKIQNFFLTGETKWAYNGGLLGMILTLADVQGEDEETGKRQQLYLHGGPKLRHVLACARRFIFRTGMPIRVYEKNVSDGFSTTSPDYTDENIDVWAIPAQARRSRSQSPTMAQSRSQSPNTVGREQALRERTVHDMFDSDWRIDKLVRSAFKDVNLPAMVWVRSSDSKDLQATFCTKMDDAPHISPDQQVFVRTPWPAALVSELPPADNLPSSVSMSYVVRGHPQRGVFDAKKAAALGVPAGPARGTLAKGEAVTLEDGTHINPEDVLGPPEPGQGMAILDVPNEDYLEDLLEHLDKLRGDGALDGVHAMTWIIGGGVLDSDQFKTAIQKFPERKHLVSSVETGPNYLSMDSSAASSVRLSQIRPDCFLVPTHSNVVLQQPSSDGLKAVESAQRGLIIQLQPKVVVKRDEVPQGLDVKSTAAATSKSIQDYLPPSGSNNGIQTSNYDDVVITTLGTGSAVPSKYRNVSANLVHVPEHGYFLFDVGENTIGQLRRLYTPEQLEDVLCNLRMIWISHLHADHHLGTMSILQAHKQAVRKRRAQDRPHEHQLYLISERNMSDYLIDYGSVETTDCVMLRCLNSEISDTNGDRINISDTDLPVKEFRTTRVSHCHGAQAVSLTFENGFKMSYSGDCRPSGKFAEIGAHSDVLIHEATFDDGLEGDAMAKKHCTIGEALGVAVAMKAKNVILTHFSQRYQKLPVLTDVKFPGGQLQFEEGDDATDPAGPLEEVNVSNNGDGNGDGNTITEISTSVNTNNTDTNASGSSLKLLQKAAAEMHVCAAFDFMRVTIPQIRDMHLYYPAIERMFEVEQGKSDARRGANRETNDMHINQRREAQAQALDKYEYINRKKRRKNRDSPDTNTNTNTNTSGRQTPITGGP